jgi:hypothetical protein
MLSILCPSGSSLTHRTRVCGSTDSRRGSNEPPSIRTVSVATGVGVGVAVAVVVVGVAVAVGVGVEARPVVVRSADVGCEGDVDALDDEDVGVESRRRLVAVSVLVSVSPRQPPSPTTASGTTRRSCRREYIHDTVAPSTKTRCGPSRDDQRADDCERHPRGFRRGKPLVEDRPAEHHREHGRQPRQERPLAGVGPRGPYELRDDGERDTAAEHDGDTSVLASERRMPRIRTTTSNVTAPSATRKKPSVTGGSRENPRTETTYIPPQRTAAASGNSAKASGYLVP